MSYVPFPWYIIESEIENLPLSIEGGRILVSSSPPRPRTAAWEYEDTNTYIPRVVYDIYDIHSTIVDSFLSITIRQPSKMLTIHTVRPRPTFLGMRTSNTNVRQGRTAMRIRAEEGAEKQTATKVSPAALRYECAAAMTRAAGWANSHEFPPIPNETRGMPRDSSTTRFLHCTTTISDSDVFAGSSRKCRAEFTSADAIQGEVDRLRAEMFTMRIKFAKREAYQPAQYRALRKRVAQLLTIQRERTVEQGVTLREARAAEKRMMVEAGLRQF